MLEWNKDAELQHCNSIERHQENIELSDTKNATDEQKASGVKPNQQQLHTSADVHMTRFMLATHPKSEMKNKDHLLTFELWSNRLFTVKMTSLILRYTKLEHPKDFNMMLGPPHDTRRMWSEEDLKAEMDTEPK